MGMALSMKMEGALLAVMEAHFGNQPVSMWTMLSRDELFEMQAWFWGHHKDIVSEWSRRQMMTAASPPTVKMEEIR